MKLMLDIYISCVYDGFCRYYDIFNYMIIVEEMKNKLVIMLNYLVSVYFYIILYFLVFLLYIILRIFFVMFSLIWIINDCFKIY